MQQHQPRISPNYDEDFYAWTQHQARLLRAVGKSASALPSDIDIDHLAEEIEDLGKSELRAVTNLIRQIVVHLIKAASAPRSDASAHWRTETITFHSEIPGYYGPSMRRLIDLEAIWKRALKLAKAALEEDGDALSPAIPSSCPFTLDDFLTEDFVPGEALGKLTAGG